MSGDRQASHLKTTTTLGAVNTPSLVMYHYGVRDSRAQCIKSPANNHRILSIFFTPAKQGAFEALAEFPQFALDNADVPNVLLRGKKPFCFICERAPAEMPGLFFKVIKMKKIDLMRFAPPASYFPIISKGQEGFQKRSLRP